MIRAFAFDLDETLADCEHHHEEATRHMLVHTGVPADIAKLLFQDVTGRRTRDIVDAFRMATGVPHGLDHLLSLRNEAFCRALGSRPPLFMPGADLLLQEACAVGPTALVTSGHAEDAWATLDALGIRGSFRTVVTGEDVDRPKPDPEPYLLAADRLRVEPFEMLAFEDSGHGVAAAKAAGCPVVAVPNPRNTRPESVAAADLIVTSLHHTLPLSRLLHDLAGGRS